MFVIDAQWDPKNLLGFHDFQDPIKASESNTSPCIPCSSNLGQVMIVMCPKVSKSVQKCPKVSKSGQKCPKVAKYQGINRGSTGHRAPLHRGFGGFTALFQLLHADSDRRDRCNRCHRTSWRHGQKLLLQFSSKLRISLGPRSLFSVENC